MTTETKGQLIADLLNLGFELLHTDTKTFGNGKITGQLLQENKKGKIIVDSDTAEETTDVFCPFFPEDKFRSVKLRTKEEISTYVNSLVLTPTDEEPNRWIHPEKGFL